MHSYFLYLVPPLSSFTNERGGLRGPRRLRRLSRDHLAHLIKHRGFNLVPRVCRRHPPTPRKTTFTSSSMAGAADSRRKKEGKGGGGDEPGAWRCVREDAHRPGDRSPLTRSSGGKSVCRSQRCHFLFFIFLYLSFFSFVSALPCFVGGSSRQRGATRGESPWLPR